MALSTITRWEIRYEDPFENSVSYKTRREARDVMWGMKNAPYGVYINIKMYRVKETRFEDGTPLMATYVRAR